MSNNADSILSILIKFGLSNEQAANAAKDIIQETGKATVKLGDDHEEAAKKVRLFHGEGKEMGRVIGELNRISPQLGEALRIAMNPVAGSVAAAVGLFVLMKEHIAEVNRELDEQAKIAADPTFIDGIRARRDILAEAMDAADKYTEHLASLQEGEQGITAELTNQLALQLAINAARGELGKANLGLEQSKIKADQAAGKISPEEAAAKMAAANAKAISDEAQQKSNAKHDEVSSKITALETAQNQQGVLEANAKALTSAHTGEAARRRKTETDFGDTAYDAKKKQADQEVDAAEKKLKADAYGSRIEKLQEMLATFKPGDNPYQKASLESQLAEAKKFAGPLVDNLDQAKNKRSLLDAGRNQFLNDQKSAGEFNELGSQAAGARQKAETNAQTIGSLSGELRRLTDVILATRGMESSATAARVSTSNNEYRAGLFQENSKIYQKEQAALRSGNPVAVKEAVGEAHTHGQELIKAATGVKGSNAEVHSAITAALNQLRTQQAAFAAQLRQTPMHTR